MSPVLRQASVSTVDHPVLYARPNMVVWMTIDGRMATSLSLAPNIQHQSSRIILLAHPRLNSRQRRLVLTSAAVAAKIMTIGQIRTSQMAILSVTLASNTSTSMSLLRLRYSIAIYVYPMKSRTVSPATPIILTLASAARLTTTLTRI